MATRQAFLKNLRDNDLRVTRALPGAASTTVNSTPIDTGIRDAFSIFPDGLEAVCKVPALNPTILPDTRTQTLTIEASDDVNFGSNVDVLGTKVVTGAGGVGATATELRVGLGGNLKRYLRAKIASGASTTDGSAVQAEFCIVA